MTYRLTKDQIMKVEAERIAARKAACKIDHDAFNEAVAACSAREAMCTSGRATVTPKRKEHRKGWQS